MRIAVVGGGPAGLYFALLAKRGDPTREITVYERNPPDATYGWGVVFSEETLSELADADHETYRRLDEALVRWSAIDIHHAGQRLRAHGHGFSAIARTALLGALQSRAAEVGVGLRFNTEVDDLAALEADCDLVVGADGIRSVVRDHHARHLRPSAEAGESRFTWLGTDFAFEVFTFVFRETAHGLFQVHAYPYSAHGSTFIVECHVDTWRRAGLDDASEEDTIAFCSELFADHLRGRRLKSNASVWRTFETIRLRSWHHGRTVLLGDAAHTAHFSIGSGTKLALEDSIALAKALAAHPADLPAAFADYELERQGPVERFQEAALDSARYFERVARYVSFDSEQFAFNLLTRSGRITRADLELRDPVTVNRVDRWMAARSEGDAALRERVVVPPPAQTPLRVGAARLPSRVAVALPPTDEAQDGLVGEASTQALVRALATGAGLVVTDPIAISGQGRITVGSPGLYADEHVAAWSKALAAAREAGEGLVAARLSHAGRRGAMRPRRDGLDRPLLGAAAWPLLAPSPIPWSSRTPVPADLGEHMAEVVTDFAEAARRADEAGFDVLLLDCADGFLLASCLSPLANRRDDAYGGDLEERLRFPLEVLDTVRAAWPNDRPLGVRLVADDRMPGGLTPDDAVAITRALADHRCDLVDVTSGHTVSSETAAPEYRRLYNVELADRIRNDAGVPTLVGGAITTLDQISTVVAAGRADACYLDLAAYTQEDQ